MTKDEIKNKISMALKDPILQQGFEIICKNLAELEKENAELNGKLLEQKQYTEFKCNEAVKKKEIYEREHFLLTKAKEIIKRFSEFVNNDIEYDPEHPREHTDLWNKLCEEAEQFLNCSEKPNN